MPYILYKYTFFLIISVLCVSNFKTGSVSALTKLLLINLPTAVNAFTTICTFVDVKSFYNVATNNINNSLSLSKNNEQHKYPNLFNARFLDYVKCIAFICTNDAS